MNNTAKQIMGVPWGERTRLIDKVMVYAFSLDLRARTKGPYLRIEKGPYLSGANGALDDTAARRDVRHLFGESIVTMPEGLRCDVPTGDIEGGEGEIGDHNDSLSSWLNLQIRSTLEGGNTKLYFAANGVINIDGGMSALRSPKAQKLTGQAFLASVQEASTGTYRWLERRQLFGIGRVESALRSDPPEASDEWLLHFSFDLYAAL